ncbi:hypothetical protein D3C75_1202650 [compost metagenome]
MQLLHLFGFLLAVFGLGCQLFLQLRHRLLGLLIVLFAARRQLILQLCDLQGLLLTLFGLGSQLFLQLRQRLLVLL